MKTSILICSHAPDAEYLKYCLRSIDKFVFNCREIVLAVPHQHYEVFKPIAAQHKDIRLHSYWCWMERAFLHHEIIKCFADTICSGEYIFHIDSDSMLTRKVNLPDDIMVNNKPVIRRQLWADVQAGEKDWGPRIWWKDQTERALGTQVDFEYMMGPPFLYHADTYLLLRQHIESVHNEPFHDYVFKQKHTPLWGFSEFNALGAFCDKHMHDDYHWVNWHDQNEFNPVSERICCVKQGWSHRPLDEVRGELEAVLA